jgi:putative restriction endonuclease
MPTEATWREWLERLYNLRRDKHGSHERPHKPVLLLSILDLIDRGKVKDNQVAFTPELASTFRRYFSVVRRHDDQPSIENPFYFLSGDGFWSIEKPGQGALYQPGNASSPPSMKVLRSAEGRFDPQLWRLMQNPVSRAQLREALVTRYFPEQRGQLASISPQHSSREFPEPGRGLQLNEEFEQARSGAFRQTILAIYDYTCAACGLRVRLNDGFSLVDAAHLIPFNVTRDDKPNNGLALCPNHHRAMDRFLISPCPDAKHRAGIWRVGPALDARLEGQRALVALDGQRVIAPSEEKFCPAVESLQWRQEQLTTKYS